jgi:ribonuclease HIII
MQQTKVLTIDVDLSEIMEYLQSHFHVMLSDSKGNFAWQLKGKDYVITAYKSGKLVFQGSNIKNIQKIQDRLIDKFLRNEKDFESRIGVDEAGKGDFFGPLVIAGVFLPNSDVITELMQAGVQDSKKLSNKKAINLKKKILQTCEFVDLVIISPSKYNKLYKKFQNVNKMLAWGHARVIENLLEVIPSGKCQKVVIDQFARSKSRVKDALMSNGKKVELEQHHKGESDIAVAAASIVARGVFLERMAKLSQKYRIEFPLGAVDVIDTGKKFIKEYNRQALSKVAKTSFRTVKQI